MSITKLFFILNAMPASRKFLGNYMSTIANFREFIAQVNLQQDAEGNFAFTSEIIRNFIKLLGTDKVVGFLSAFFDVDAIKPMVDAASTDDPSAQELADMINTFLYGN